MHGELFAQTAGGETSAITELALSLLAGVGSPDFQEQLARSLKRHVKVDAGLILLYRRDAAPKILFNDWCNDGGSPTSAAICRVPIGWIHSIGLRWTMAMTDFTD